MSLTPTPEQAELRSQARRFLAERSGASQVRRRMEDPAGLDRALWSELAALGWLGAAIPEAHGGAGLGQAELALLLEEQGRALLCAPYFSTACIGVGLLRALGSPAQQRRWLPAIAAGDCVTALALAEPDGRWDAAGVRLQARPHGGGHVLEGTKAFVCDGLAADLLLVAARTPAGDGGEDAAEGAGVSLFAVEARAAGLQRTPMKAMDATRPLAQVVFDRVAVGAEGLLGAPGRAWPALRHVLDLAAVGLAAEQLGVGERAFEMALDYARLRTAFGRPIGAFQAIKHQCADLLTDLESARSVVLHAAQAADEAGPAGLQPDPGLLAEPLARMAPLAKAYCSEVACRATHRNILIHGGIGFTWEHDAHLYFKRAKSSSILFGDTAHHQERLARELGL